MSMLQFVGGLVAMVAIVVGGAVWIVSELRAVEKGVIEAIKYHELHGIHPKHELRETAERREADLRRIIDSIQR